jgi:ABC-type bacteriocin/lantibiotic exporter with double-glycine peptidase domain
MSVETAPLQIGLGSALIARQLGVQLAADRIETAFEDGELSSLKAISSFFAKVGISVRFRSVRLRDLQKRSYLFPAVAILRNGRAVVLAGLRHDEEDDGKKTTKLIALDPADPSGRPVDMDVEDFSAAWSGRIALVTRISGEESKDRSFDWRWFLPEIARFKWLLLLALAISLILHALAFAPIIFLQTALDKVIGYEATETLFVLTIGVLLALLFTGILGYARDYITRFVARAIEARLAGDAFDKLLDLPMQTFAGAESSSLESGIQGVTSIRFFLVRQVLGGIFDLSALIVFLPILIAYSVPLGLLVIGFAVVMGAASLTFRLMERRMARQTGGLERDRNLVLRDTIRGIDTVKPCLRNPANGANGGARRRPPSALMFARSAFRWRLPRSIRCSSRP